MKLLIAGSRDVVVDSDQISRYTGGLNITQLVSGGARGVDRAGEKWAEENGIEIVPFIPDWDDLTHPEARIKTNQWGKKYDANAGHRRNKEMADYADMAIVFWDGKSPGSKNMIENMEKQGKSCVVVMV